MRAGREEEYHGVAVHPRHLSRYERYVLKCGPATVLAVHALCLVLPSTACQHRLPSAAPYIWQ